MNNDRSVAAYPLTWPEGWPKPKKRIDSKFKPRSIAACVDELLRQLRQLGADSRNVIISSDLRLRNDGLPYSGQPQPADPGVSVWWQTRGGDRKVIALGQYKKVEENMYAIAMTLEAMRGIKRWGGGETLDRAFTNFVSLPSPAGPSWRDVIGYSGDVLAVAEVAYRRARQEAHPDKGGTAEKFHAVEQAWRECCAELS